MAVDTAPELRFGVANEGLTSQADLAKHLGLAEVLARSMRPKQRRRGNRDAQMLLSLIYSQCVCEASQRVGCLARRPAAGPDVALWPVHQSGRVRLQAWVGIGELAHIAQL